MDYQKMPSKDLKEVLIKLSRKKEMKSENKTLFIKLNLNKKH